MQFSYHLPDGSRSKNPACIVDDLIFLEVPTSGYHPVHVTGSVADSYLFCNHRWREVEGRIVTTLPGPNGYEVAHSLGNLLLKRHPRESVVCDSNPYDFRRDSLAPRTKASKPSPVVTVEGQTCIELSNGTLAAVSPESIPTIQAYRFNFIRRSREGRDDQITIRAVTRDEHGSKRALILPRIILGLEMNSPLLVIHRNSDPLDCRRENLLAVSSTQAKSYVAENAPPRLAFLNPSPETDQ